MPPPGRRTCRLPPSRPPRRGRGRPRRATTPRAGRRTPAGRPGSEVRMARAYPEPPPSAANRPSVPACTGRGSCSGAPMPSTFDREPPGPASHCPRAARRRYGVPRQPSARRPGATWGVGHGPGTGDARSWRTPLAASSGWVPPIPATSRVTTGNRPAGPEAATATVSSAGGLLPSDRIIERVCGAPGAGRPAVRPVPRPRARRCAGPAGPRRRAMHPAAGGAPRVSPPARPPARPQPPGPRRAGRDRG